MAYPTPSALHERGSELHLSSAELHLSSAELHLGSAELHLGTSGAELGSVSGAAARTPHAGLPYPYTQFHLASPATQYAAPMPQHQGVLQNRLLASDCVSSSAMASPATPYTYPLQPHAAGVSSAGPVQLWMGDIEPWMDDECIRQIWARVGEMVTAKMIRDRLTGMPANYCFIEFQTQGDAERILGLYNGVPMPPPFERPFRLNWASGGPAIGGPLTMLPPAGLLAAASNAVSAQTGLSASSAEYGSADVSSAPAPFLAVMPQHPNGGAEAQEHSLFVGDLAPEVTDVQLAREFRLRYASVRTAKVVTDPITLQPRGYGFVRFSDAAERQRALVEMQGQVIGTRAIRVSTATPKRTPTMSTAFGQHGHPTPDDANGRDATRSPASSVSSTDSNALYNPATDPFNKTVFVGGLVNPVTEDELKAFFAVYGEVVYCKIPPGRGCGFVTFANRSNAETAIRTLNGHVLGGSRVRLSWGRSQSHARHNYRHHHRHSGRHHAHQGCHNHNVSSGSGSVSGANSHRNSVSEQHPLYSRRSVSFGKGSVSAAPSSNLGLGLSGAPIPGTAPAPSMHQAQQGVVSLEPSGPGSLRSAVPGLTNAAQPSPALLGGGYIGMPLTQQPQLQTPSQQQLGDHGLAPHSAFYTLSPMHPATALGMEAFAADGSIRSNAIGAPLGQASIGYPQQQAVPQQLYYHPQQHPQPQSMLPVPMHGNGQLDGLYAGAPQEARGSGLTPACPTNLLTRRLSTLTLGSSNNSTNAAGNSRADTQPPALDRRASAGVIGQRRLSAKPSFGQQAPVPQKSSSQLSLAQLWPQPGALDSYATGTPHTSQLGEYHHGALSTPASSARLSTSSLSLLALPQAGGGDASRDTSARPSMDEQSKRLSYQDHHLDLGANGA
ncbi:hypothetical protein GGF46_005533 [Coemansia sp. RSA 552]|nr:hypothetical protein GGF46_005533 [Coemansia sp. RSA 552]